MSDAPPSRQIRLHMAPLYAQFAAPVTEIDCGQMCAPHNPNGKPFCCDICHAVPVAFHAEWAYLRAHTDLWHEWRGDECPGDPTPPEELRAEIPAHQLALACLGPAYCQREYRAVSCRQFPFFPYIASDDRFLGLAYTWDFEPVCWVISHLEAVSTNYRAEFIALYDEILAVWDDEFDSYANLGAEMREVFAARRRRIPLLHRNGGTYLISPASERLTRVTAAALPRFGPYRPTSSPPPLV